MRKLKILFPIILATVFLTFCRPVPVIIYQKDLSKFENEIARADNNYSLTTAQFYQRLANSTMLPKGGILEKSIVKELVDSMVVDTLLGFEATEVDLSNHYEYYSRYRASYATLMSDVYYNNAIHSKVSVDTSEIFKYIREHTEEFSLKEQMQTRHIVISKLSLKHGPDSLKYRAMSDSALEQASKEIAFHLKSGINSKDEFIEAAKKFSHDEVSARRGGLIEWVQRGFFAWPFDSVAFAARPGDIVGPYRDKDGWQILYIEHYIPEGVPPLNQQQYAIARSKVLSDKIREYSMQVFDTLFSDMEIEYNESLYDTNIYKVDKPIWAAIVNQADTIDFGDLRVGEEKIKKTYNVSSSTVEMKKEMVRIIARKWVIVQQARKMKLDTLPHIAKQIAGLKHTFSRHIVESRIINHRWKPTTEQMKDYYQENIDKYAVEKPFNVQHILVEDSLFAEFVRDQAIAGADFMKLARDYYPGEEEIRIELADLGFIGPDDVSAEFFETARVTGAGQISRPVQTEYGYHIIKVIEKKMTVSFKRAVPEIQKILKIIDFERQKAEVKKKLFTKYNVSISNRIFPIHLKPLGQRRESDEGNGS
ncbi:MAG: peptidylprolyl isomerase [candidate division Zixibacteria bacterium]|nr:peptidylprolyl isomerase [candidate division Zixibacteria bacterium]